MMEIKETLSQKSLVIIFAYAPAGLGHLRVSDALYHGLPDEVTPLLLGSQDKTIATWHRLMSSHPLGRRLMEWIQQGWPEDFFTGIYRRHLRMHTTSLYQQLTMILEQRIDLPKNMLVVSTHFGLAHQLAAVKEQLKREKGVNVYLVVVLTDDSPQHIWYIPGADLTFVPSENTKEVLTRYGRQNRLDPITIEVVAYPVSPFLSRALTERQQKERLTQVASGDSLIHVAVPISGAAVGLTYNTRLIDALHGYSSRFHFHVVSKTVPYTEKFLTEMVRRDYVVLSASAHAREIVDKYIDLYRDHVVSLEVTKPSEQAFKALLTHTQIGGSLLLFSKPVGRQEYDNLDFLRRHNLLPLRTEKQELWEKAARQVNLQKQAEGRQLLKEAVNWRGLELPDDSRIAASFIWWCLTQRVLTKMMACQVKPHPNDTHAHELSSAGVTKIWDKVADFINSQL